jgi:nucleotide-binding universal stress UspA family protein
VAGFPALTRIARIVVGLDGSKNAHHALEWAILLASSFDAEVVAVHAVGLLAHGADGSMVPSHSHIGEIREAFESQWCAGLDSAGLKSRKVCREGPPAQVLLDVAEQAGADLLVVGSRGIGGVANLLLGSTSLQLVEHARHPVLVVPSRAGG